VSKKVQWTFARRRAKHRCRQSRGSDDADGNLVKTGGYRVLADIQDFSSAVQAWPVTSHRIRMMGNGIPITQSSTERMRLSPGFQKPILWRDNKCLMKWFHA
jgi:hypothetical protein